MDKEQQYDPEVLKEIPPELLAEAEGEWFAVNPKQDCPHQENLNWKEIVGNLSKKTITLPCTKCDNDKENWMCLSCYEIRCSRYVKGHMGDHNKETKHPISLSFSDGSFWCYDCESYVFSPGLRELAMTFSDIKFPSDKEGRIDINDVVN
mmetsp:Transcript_3837/g.3276  ORF Transcript_3837/g.3276 Transcript_3837/m.3276 type:complete len:150 (-) Transcript_3837:99-548(-)